MNAAEAVRELKRPKVLITKRKGGVIDLVLVVNGVAQELDPKNIVDVSKWKEGDTGEIDL